MQKIIAVLIPIFLIAAFSGCGRKQPSLGQTAELMKFPLDNLAGLITRSGIEIDRNVSSDGKGALRIIAEQPRVVRLFELGDVDIEDARIIYQARLRTEDVKGNVYLEMWCHFPGMGEFFSRSTQSPLTGTVNWISEETPFFLRQGQNPDNIKLNVVIEGTGVVWINDIKVLRWQARK